MASSRSSGAGIAGLLIWISTQIGEGTTGGYWAVYGLVAGAGLTMALAQLFGGWTKWGLPRLSAGVFLVGFLPVLVCRGLGAARRPAGCQLVPASHRQLVGRHRDHGLVDDLRQYLGVLAFGLGLTFGFTFDTTGPAVARTTPAPLPRRMADEPVDADATAVLEPVEEPEPVPVRVPAAD